MDTFWYCCKRTIQDLTKESFYKFTTQTRKLRLKERKLPLKWLKVRGPQDAG